MKSGMNGVGLGLIYVLLGSESTFFSGLGGGMLILGFRDLMYPTKLENGYSKVRKATLLLSLIKNHHFSNRF